MLYNFRSIALFYFFNDKSSDMGRISVITFFHQNPVTVHFRFRLQEVATVSPHSSSGQSDHGKPCEATEE